MILQTAPGKWIAISGRFKRISSLVEQSTTRNSFQAIEVEDNGGLSWKQLVV
jgi:hypothetical protein